MDKTPITSQDMWATQLDPIQSTPTLGQHGPSSQHATVHRASTNNSSSPTVLNANLTIRHNNSNSKHRSDYQALYQARKSHIVGRTDGVATMALHAPASTHSMWQRQSARATPTMGEKKAISTIIDG